MHLIEEHGISEEEQGPTLREEAYSFARARLKAHRDKVITVAELLVEHGRIEAEEVALLMQTNAQAAASDRVRGSGAPD
jgi:ATP-dependent Zn protease